MAESIIITAVIIALILLLLIIICFAYLFRRLRRSKVGLGQNTGDGSQMKRTTTTAQTTETSKDTPQTLQSAKPSDDGVEEQPAQQPASGKTQSPATGKSGLNVRAIPNWTMRDQISFLAELENEGARLARISTKGLSAETRYMHTFMKKCARNRQILEDEAEPEEDESLRAFSMERPEMSPNECPHVDMEMLRAKELPELNKEEHMYEQRFIDKTMGVWGAGLKLDPLKPKLSAHEKEALECYKKRAAIFPELQTRADGYIFGAECAKVDFVSDAKFTFSPEKTKSTKSGKKTPAKTSQKSKRATSKPPDKSRKAKSPSGTK